MSLTQLQLSQRSSQKQWKLKNGSQVQSSKRRGDNKQERRWTARKCKRERGKRAGGKVGQQEPRASSHYDSSSSCMSPGVDCKPQSPRPDRETGEDRCESGCTRRGELQQRGAAHEAKTWSHRFTLSTPAVSITVTVSAGTATVQKSQEVKFGRVGELSLCIL